jgi:hypothetical protein
MGLKSMILKIDRGQANLRAGLNDSSLICDVWSNVAKKERVEFTTLPFFINVSR